MPPCRELIARQERGLGWDCCDVPPSLKRGGDPLNVSPHPAGPCCSSLPQFTPEQAGVGMSRKHEPLWGGWGFPE